MLYYSLQGNVTYNKDKHVDLVIVIMAGGIGTRFWPVSTETKPKQFLKLFGERSMLQESYRRIRDLVPPERVLILTNENFLGQVREQLPDIPSYNIIGEPMRRDTAAAVALSALISRKRFGNPVILTLTADHVIEPVDMFQKTVLSAARMASQQEVLYTFGIRPAYPATGYGYLERGQHIVSDDGIEHYGLLRFKEKPDLETARHYLESGQYYWNSGMFVWSTDTILKQFELFLPDHITSLSTAAETDEKTIDTSVLKKAFEQIAAISIDFGIMEKASNVCCIESDFTWNDLGGWLSLKDFIPVDNKGNHHRGEIIASDAHDNLVFCENPDETVMMLGIQDLVIVRAGDKTLVVRKDMVEDVKELVNVFMRKDD